MVRAGDPPLENTALLLLAVSTGCGRGGATTGVPGAVAMLLFELPLLSAWIAGLLLSTATACRGGGGTLIVTAGVGVMTGAEVLLELSARVAAGAVAFRGAASFSTASS